MWTPSTILIRRTRGDGIHVHPRCRSPFLEPVEHPACRAWGDVFNCTSILGRRSGHLGGSVKITSNVGPNRTATAAEGCWGLLFNCNPFWNTRAKLGLWAMEMESARQ